ncbi:hypothetical protein AgCh_023890 [Apium graveolens]
MEWGYWRKYRHFKSTLAVRDGLKIVCTGRKRQLVYIQSEAIWKAQNELVWQKKRSLIENVAKPQENSIKVSVDAAKFLDNEAYGIGLVVRNSDGEAEQAIEVESGRKVVVQLIRNTVPMVSPVGRIIEECQELLLELNNVSLYFVKQSANKVAHSLARDLILFLIELSTGVMFPWKLNSVFWMIWL